MPPSLLPPTLPRIATAPDNTPSDSKMSTHDLHDDDPVVSSVPVYLNHALAHQLYLVHYPLRPYTRPYSQDGEGSEPEVKLKPSQHRLAFAYPIDTTNATSEQYNANHGYPVRQLQLQTSVVAQAATLAPAGTHATPTAAQKPAASSSAHVSSKSTSSNYTLALHSPSHQSLHLTPISTVLRAVPNMAYVEDYSKEAIEERERKLDREFIVDDTRGDTDEEATDGATIKSEKSDEKEGDGTEDGDKYKPLLVRFRKRETERSAAMRQRSYAYLQQQDLKEDWLTLKYQNSHSEAAEMAKADGLVCTTTAQQPALPVMQSAKAYLHQTLYGSSAPSINMPIASNSTPTTPKQAQATNPADEAMQRQLLPLLRSSHILSTRQLCRVLQLFSPQDLQPYLPLLQQHAHFVHGNWIVRSSTLGTSVQSSRLALCRNHLIARLAVEGTVNKADIAQKLKLPIDDYNALFNELCVKQLSSSDVKHAPPSTAHTPTTRSTYRLKLPNDDAVAASLSDVTDKHLNECQQMLQATTLQLEQTSQAAASAVLQRDSAPPASPHSKLSTPTSQHKSSPASGAKSNAAAVQQTVKQAQVFVSSLLREHGVCNRQFIEQQLQKQKQQYQRQSSPQRNNPPVDAGSYLQFLTTELLTQVLQSSCYCLTPTLFAIQSTNNEQTDRYRHIIGQLLVKKGKVKKAEVEHAIATHSNGDTLDYRTYATLMKEFAVFDKSGSEWKLKAGTG